MNLLVTRWVDPVCQSPRRRAYGYFTHGTAPPPCSFLICFAVSSPPSSPAAFPNSFRCRFPGHAVLAALLVLHSRPLTDTASLATSLSLIGLFTPGQPETLSVFLRSRTVLPYRAIRKHLGAAGE